MRTPPSAIRSAQQRDLPAIATVEAAAGQRFVEIGMVDIAADPVPTASYFAGYQRAGRAWVAVDPVDRAIAYALLDLIDGYGHIEQVSVHPEYAHRGIGRALIDHAAGWAEATGLHALTLFTFADVPWNAPYYRRCGFGVLPDSQLTPGLREAWRRESLRGLDRWPRVCLVRWLARPDRQSPRPPLIRRPTSRRGDITHAFCRGCDTAVSENDPLISPFRPATVGPTPPRIGSPGRPT